MRETKFAHVSWVLAGCRSDETFMKSFRPNARVLSFDLPLHGQTTVKKRKALGVGDLAELQGKALQET